MGKKIIKISLIAIITIIGIATLLFAADRIKENYGYNYKITARFKELGPVYKSMPVYYKGFKIGKTRKIEPSENYQFSQVTIILYPKKLLLPENISAKVKKLDSGKDYIELVYPDMPSVELLKSGTIIEGKTAMDIESFMSAQAESGVFASISDNMGSTLKSVEKTSDEVNLFFKDLREIMKENRVNIKTTTKNTAEITTNINSITKKLDKSLSAEKLENSAANLNQTTTNLKESTELILYIAKNIELVTKDLDKSKKKLDAILEEVHVSMLNIKGISCGFCELMGKRAAGARFLFGKPVSCKKCRTCLETTKTKPPEPVKKTEEAKEPEPAQNKN